MIEMGVNRICTLSLKYDYTLIYLKLSVDHRPQSIDGQVFFFRIPSFRDGMRNLMV